jgi:hypothetical protein
MKLPRLTAELSVGAATGVYRSGPGAGGRPALVPMASLSCLSGCVGSQNASRCAAQCANAADPVACWMQCSGTSDPGCIQACFRS